MTESIEVKQKKIIREANLYISECKKKNIDISLSPLCFMTSWAYTPGYINLMWLRKIYKFKDFYIFLKNILAIGFNHDVFLDCKEKEVFNSQKNYPAIIISWCKFEDFDRQGYFFDRYFNINSKKYNKYLWFLLSIDNKTPKNVRENIFILKKRKNKSFGLFFFIREFLKLILTFKFSLRKIFHYSSRSFNFSTIASNEFKKIIEKNKISRTIMLYEGQPHQNAIFKTAKEYNRNIKTIGYLHGAPWPLQIDLIYKQDFIDRLFVSGDSQKKTLIKNYRWKKKKIISIPSIRFNKKYKRDFAGYIFFPYQLFEKKNYINKLELYLSMLPDKSLNPLKVRIHPLNFSDTRHLVFKKEVEIIMNKFKKKFNYKINNSTSIFFGPPGGTAVQALETGTRVIHFPQDSIFDVYSNTLWPDIEVLKIDEDMYQYMLKKEGKLIKFNQSKNRYKRFILDKIRNLK